LLAFSSFSGLYTGAICHFVYALYPPVVLRFFPAWFAQSPLRVGLGCTFLDNGVHSPFAYLPAFYLWVDTVQGASVGSALEHLKREWLEVWLHCIGMWIPLQALNFSLVPAAHRVVFVNACNLVWMVVLDWLSNREERAKEGSGAKDAEDEQGSSGVRVSAGTGSSKSKS
jgi:hypothetical protein